jgi:anti-sigma factor RsiW
MNDGSGNMNDLKFSKAENCPTEDVLLDYTAGRLDPARTALFNLHADRCPECASLRASQSAVWLALDEWKPAPVSIGFNRELWRMIDADAQKSTWASAWGAAMRLSLWKRVAPLALGMVVVVTAFVWDHSASQAGKMPANSNAPIVVTASDADQLDRALDDIQLLDSVDAAAAQAKPDARLM